MPFSQTTELHTEEYWTHHFEKFLKPSLKKQIPKLIIRRSEPLRGDVLNQIIVDLIQSQIVIADITDLNTNVIWELGIRQSFRHGTITIAEEGTVLPFDLQRKGTLFYSFNNHPYGDKPTEFLKKLAESIQDCLNNPDRPDSPILEATSGRGTFYEIISKGETIRKLDALDLELKFNKILLDILLKAVRANKQIFDQITRLKNEPNKTTTRKKINALSSKVGWPTHKLRTQAISLLLSTFYLNKEAAFYYDCSMYFQDLDRINDRIVACQYQGDLENEYLVKHVPGIVKNTKTINKKILEIKKELLKIS
jgi:hypothetical protein